MIIYFFISIDNSLKLSAFNAVNVTQFSFCFVHNIFKQNITKFDTAQNTVVLRKVLCNILNYKQR